MRALACDAMSVVPATEELSGHRRIRDWLGDRIMFGLTLAAALATVAIMVLIAYKVVRGADLSFRAFGLSFVWDSIWDTHTNKEVYGAGQFLFGTAVTSLIALIIAVPLAIAIALFLSELAPSGVRVIVVGSLVETLAAIPSVVLGLWGILVMGPFVANHVEPSLHSWFGFLPIFGGKPGSSGIFIAGLVLAIMVVPIVASICRELFLSVRTTWRRALALGATRWEMVKGVILHSSRPGIAAAVILGLGRAIGEAIAVTQVIGAATAIHVSLFDPGDTLASRIAGQYQGAVSNVQISALFYLAAILLVIGLLTNLLAQMIVRRFDVHGAGAR